MRLAEQLLHLAVCFAPYVLPAAANDSASTMALPPPTARPVHDVSISVIAHGADPTGKVDATAAFRAALAAGVAAAEGTGPAVPVVVLFQ